MGSGVSGLYGGTYGAGVNIGVIGGNGGFPDVRDERRPQPYGASYGVTEDMLEYDKRRGVYSEKAGYSLNPTTINALESLKDGILVDREGKPMQGDYTYAVKENGDLVIGKRNGNGRDGKPTPHPTLVGGKEPRVKVAGMVTIADGKIVKYNNESGHFKPNVLSMPEADKAFSQLPESAFHRNFKKNMGRR